MTNLVSMALGEVFHVTSCHLLQKDIAEIFMETYKFNFGKMDRVRVANIISSICNSTNINGRSIGKIQIFNDYSLVDLPRDLHGEVRNKLRNLRIRN